MAFEVFFNYFRVLLLVMRLTSRCFQVNPLFPRFWGLFTPLRKSHRYRRGRERVVVLLSLVGVSLLVCKSITFFLVYPFSSLISSSLMALASLMCVLLSVAFLACWEFPFTCSFFILVSAQVFLCWFSSRPFGLVVVHLFLHLLLYFYT